MFLSKWECTHNMYNVNSYVTFSYSCQSEVFGGNDCKITAAYSCKLYVMSVNSSILEIDHLLLPTTVMCTLYMLQILKLAHYTICAVTLDTQTIAK